MDEAAYSWRIVCVEAKESVAGVYVEVECLGG